MTTTNNVHPGFFLVLTRGWTYFCNMNWGGMTRIAGIALLGMLPLCADPVQVLFSLTGTGGAYAGADPKGSLIRQGSTLYGFTSAGGPGDGGVIFSVQTDGSGYTLLASFASGDAAGDTPHHGYLTLDGTTVIRPIYQGGSDGDGTIFSVQTNGANPTVNHTFTGSANLPTSLGDGNLPHSGLLNGGGQLYYGLTSGGGTNNKGIIYSYNAATGTTTTLYAFADATGWNPHGQLSWDSTGTLLLGMTRAGGTGTGNSNSGNQPPGVIFSFNPATSQYNVLYNFTDAGGTPYFTDHGILTLGTGANATNVFGMTEYGGSADNGAIFSMSETGSLTLNLLHSFQGGTSDGSDPFGSLGLGPDGYLYGTTRNGGTSDGGTVFRIGQDGSDYSVLASLDDATGKHPIDNVVFSADGTMLYGFADDGGANNFGTVFELSVVPEPGTCWLLLLSGIGLVATRVRRRIARK